MQADAARALTQFRLLPSTVAVIISNQLYSVSNKYRIYRFCYTRTVLFLQYFLSTDSAYLPGAWRNFLKSSQPAEGVASVHMIQRLRAVPEQPETYGVLVFQVVLHNPRGWNKTEAADRYQGGGQEHPKTPDTAEHPRGVGQRDRRQIDSQPFPITVKQCMHLKCAHSLWK